MGGGGEGIALYYSTQVFSCAEPTLFDIAPASARAVTEQHLALRGCHHRVLSGVRPREDAHLLSFFMSQYQNFNAMLSIDVGASKTFMFLGFITQLFFVIHRQRKSLDQSRGHGLHFCQ